MTGFLGPGDPSSLSLARFGEDRDPHNDGLSAEDCLFIWGCCCFGTLDCGAATVVPVVGTLGSSQCVV